MKLYLAPMDGVVDWVMRDLLTGIGGIDQCVTEFIRVVDQVFPEQVFLKKCPELKTNGKTRWGVPVFVQLLGGQSEPMALNALKAIELGALGVDINFGCPAKTVNRNDGGATLLKSCDRIYNIVSAVRKAVPKSVPVTVKIRLGFEEPTKCVEIASSIASAGADVLTVHCRTKTDGYKPPAYWDWIPKIREQTNIDMVVNGEIWNLEDFKRCKSQTNEENFMIGRGALADPFLFKKIKDFYAKESFSDFQWQETRKLLPKFYESSQVFCNDDFAVARTKQWLKSLAIKHLEAAEVFQETKVLVKPFEFRERLEKLCHMDNESCP